MKRTITFLDIQIDTYWSIVIILTICFVMAMIFFELGEQFGQALAT